MGAQKGETAEQAIIRCANNLVKAVIAGGYSLHETDNMSGLEINFYRCHQGEIRIENILSGWKIKGKTRLMVTFEDKSV